MKFRDDYYFLSNMYPCSVTVSIAGREYRFNSGEAAFQAMKDPRMAHKFVDLNGYDAKKMGKLVSIRPDWNTYRITAMRTVVMAKFTQNPGLMTRLRSIQGGIAEDNTWGDKFWGRCNGVGENWLGKILMEVRDGRLYA